MNTMTYEEYCELKLNSQCRHLLIPGMSNDCLYKHLADIMANCTIRRTEEPVTYEEALFNSILPELMERFRNLSR